MMPVEQCVGSGVTVVQNDNGSAPATPPRPEIHALIGHPNRENPYLDIFKRHQAGTCVIGALIDLGRATFKARKELARPWISIGYQLRAIRSRSPHRWLARKFRSSN